MTLHPSHSPARAGRPFTVSFGDSINDTGNDITATRTAGPPISISPPQGGGISAGLDFATPPIANAAVCDPTGHAAQVMFWQAVRPGFAIHSIMVERKLDIINNIELS
jgi:phospholipase/lecithinase/hemolysin